MKKKILNTKYKIPVAYHFTFWIGYFLFNLIRWGSYFNDYWYSLKSNLVEFPLHILIVYFTIYYLIPKLIFNKRYITFIIYFVLSLTLLYLIRTELNFFLVSEKIWPEAIEDQQRAFTFNHIIAVVLGEVYVISLVSAIKLTIDWVYEKRRNDDLKKIQLQTELRLLKTQIQPHFFFNTLNNLYALSIDKSDNVPDVILKLSEIMQYVLYDVKNPTIGLLKEINYIGAYLELEKLRYGDTVKTHLSIKGNIDDTQVPPLLFLPFIENCFKHGTKNNDDILINIIFKKKDKDLIFMVENTYSHNVEKLIKQGIGLVNVKRRLYLLYRHKFKLSINPVGNKYKITLKIPV